MVYLYFANVCVIPCKHDGMKEWCFDIKLFKSLIHRYLYFLYFYFYHFQKLNANKATRLHVEKTTSKQYRMFDCDFVI